MKIRQANFQRELFLRILLQLVCYGFPPGGSRDWGPPMSPGPSTQERVEAHFADTSFKTGAPEGSVLVLPREGQNTTVTAPATRLLDSG